MTTVFYLITVWELHSSPEGQRHRRFRRRRGSRFVLPSGTLTANRRLRRHCIAWLRAKTGAPRWRHWIWIRHLTRWSIYNSAFVRILWAVRIINRGQESGTAVASVDATAIDFGGRLFCRYYCRDGKWHCHGTICKKKGRTTTDIHWWYHCSYPTSALTFLYREMGKVARYSLRSEDKKNMKTTNPGHHEVCQPGPGTAKRNPVYKYPKNRYCNDQNRGYWRLL